MLASPNLTLALPKGVAVTVQVWLGSSACYESVLDVVNYNNLLLDREHVKLVD